MNKKFVSVVMAITISVSLAVPSFASTSKISNEVSEVSNIYKINEYDLLVAKSEMSSCNITQPEAPSVEELLLEKASLSVETLRAKGYSDEQIELLKGYDGSALSENPQMRGVFADFNAAIAWGPVSTNELTVMLNWWWDGEPLLSGTLITENIGIAFSAANAASEPMNVRISNSSCAVYYYTGTTFTTTKFYTPTVTSPNQFAKLAFPMGLSSGAYAQGGVLEVTFVPQASGNPISAVSVAFGYDHIANGTGIDVSIGVGLIGLGFTYSGENMYYGASTGYSDGSYIIHS